MLTESDGKYRCFGDKPGQDLYAAYHDHEWGRPAPDDRHLFEMLVLEGAQAGLSWETILKRRNGYRRAYHNFDPAKVAAMSDADLEALRADTGIIRNRLKIYAARTNAEIFLSLQQDYGSFETYLKSFIPDAPRINHWQTLKDVPVTTAESDALARDLKQRGMKFVGSTIIYAYMQAVGLVDDHVARCWLRAEDPKK